MKRERDLSNLLAGHRPADAAEAAHLERALALARSPDDPFARASFEPGHFTVSAFVLGSASEGLLMILHEGLGRWLQPGGHVEPHDPSLRHAALREVAEETGLEELELADGVLDIDVHPIPARGLEPAHLHFDLRFLARPSSATPWRPDAARGVRWVGLDEMPRLNDEPAMRRVLRKLAGGASARFEETTWTSTARLPRDPDSDRSPAGWLSRWPRRLRSRRPTG